MNENLMRSTFQVFEDCQIVSRPSKSYRSKYEGLLKAVQNLDPTRSVILPLMKYGLDNKAAVGLLTSLRPLAKKKYGYRLGGTVHGQDLYIWRNPN